MIHFQTLEQMSQLAELTRSGFTDWQCYGDVKAVYKDDLVLFSYTQQAQYAGRWNWFERVSRGLILNSETGEVVARPFDRFFNLGERQPVLGAQLKEVTAKLDGSLGISYYHNNEWKISTRGSFDSEQAIWATLHLRKQYNSFCNYPRTRNHTPLFEIIYPDNRIVIDYGQDEKLALLAMRHIESGAYLPYTELEVVASQFGFQIPKLFQMDTNDCLELAKTIDANAEGWVLLFSDGSRFKVKGDRYKEVHRIIANATFNGILKSMTNATFDEMTENVPDEFLDQIMEWHNEIEDRITQITQRVSYVFQDTPKTTRKLFAQWVTQHHPRLSGYLFRMFDGKDFRQDILKKEWKR